MEKLRKTIYDVLVFIISLCITGSISVSNIATKDTSHVNLKIDETSQQQEIMGWGAAAAWWPQVAGASNNEAPVQQRGSRAQRLPLQCRLRRKAEP